MNNSRLRTLGEALGVAAVVGSLIFVGLEIRQNTVATRAAAFQSAFGEWNTWWTEVGTDRAAWEAVERVIAMDDYARADPVDLRVAQGTAGALFTAYANTHYHFTEGLIGADVWDPIRWGLEGQLLGRRGDSWSRFLVSQFDRLGGSAPEHFQMLVDSILMQREGN
jgi:hypothetical protein